MRNLLTIVAALGLLLVASSGPAQSSFSSAQWWPPAQREAQQQFEAALNAVPAPSSLRAYHDLLGSEPHIAGTPGDQRTIERMKEAFESMEGLDVLVHEFWPLLATPIDAKLDLLTLEPIGIGEHQELQLQWMPHELRIKEAEEGWAANPELTIGFNAYSGSGDVTGEVVYANYGTKADFEKLKTLGIDCTGKIVIARYGANFRGYKARFAEQAGAVGLVIYTDPADSGYMQGVPYPEGGWANDTCIQRGSLKTLPYVGDALTPGEPATEDAKRLDPGEVDLPRIPVQPIGYGAAQQIITRMKGEPLPRDLVKAWQGGIPCAYRLTGGSKLKLHLMVKQERIIAKTANVIATLRGSTFPEQKVIIGCHHDAWGYGACDPLAGTILVFEAARSFAEAARQGHRPARSIVFATWGAEEYGIIGSTEYCEQYRDDLSRNAIAYINLDMAAMGPNFGASSAPTLKRIIEQVARDVTQARQPHQPMHQSWLGDKKEPPFGNLGGGSDHVGFYCHLGIPSCSLGGDGAAGTSYHSNYDHLEWYRKVVGDDYEPALMLTRAVNLLAARLANGAVLPLDPVRYAIDAKAHLEALAKRAQELNVHTDLGPLTAHIARCETSWNDIASRLAAALEADRLSTQQLAQINQIVLGLERQWLSPIDSSPIQSEQPNCWAARAWFRNQFATSDPSSGYAAWMLPALRQSIEQTDPPALEQAAQMYRSVLDRLSQELEAINGIVNQPAPPAGTP